MTPLHPPRTHRVRNTILAAVIAVVLTIAAIAGWALNRYVFDHVEIANASSYETSLAAECSSEGSSVVSVATQSTNEPAITITSQTYGTGDDATTYYVADVVLDDITQLQSAFAEDSFGLNITQDPSDIAADVGASFAINGDYYGFRTSGIEIRNGVAYRDDGARVGAVIYSDGTMAVYDETSTSADALLADGAWLTLSFGPALVDDGVVVDGIDQVEIDTNIGNHSIQGDQPRTAIGMISANHFVFVVVDGRSDANAGVTLPELAEIMTGLGATEAYNLDGGGSATMVSEGQVVNDLSGKGDERGVSDILWIG
ncbi:MAG TPA: phosphodiester glycosidase family protein [Demequina sp.]|nr:phosphodiester glycosidase family protein [Demequina sp.]